MAKFEIQGGNMTDKQFRKELRKYGLQYRRWGSMKILCAWPNYRDAKSQKHIQFYMGLSVSYRLTSRMVQYH